MTSIPDSPPLLLSEADVSRWLSPGDAFSLMAEAFMRHSGGRAWTPLRNVLPLPEQGGVLAFMPAHVKERAFGVKVVTALRAPGQGHLPLQASILLLSPESGRPLAWVEGASITALRTAAASAVATDALARKSARSLGLIGAGVQAFHHLQALWRVRDFRDVRVFSRTPERRDEFVRRAQAMAPSGARVVAVSSAEEATRDSEVVCTLTNAREPVLRREWLSPGAHVNAVGASVRACREIDAETVRAARVFVDSRESANHEASDLLIPLEQGVIQREHFEAELGEVLLGKRPGRRDDVELTLFKSLGIAVQDVLAANYVYERAARA